MLRQLHELDEEAVMGNGKLGAREPSYPERLRQSYTESHKGLLDTSSK